MALPLALVFRGCFAGAGSASVGGDCAARLPLVAGAMFGEVGVDVVVGSVAIQAEITRLEVSLRLLIYLSKAVVR